jgi:murein L,D-transpeptidase YcbB/YkuD
MLRTRLLVSTLGFCLGFSPVFASGPQQPPAADTVPAGQVSAPSPDDFLPPPPPAQQPLAAELAPPGFFDEFTQRLNSNDRRLTAAERTDRAGLLQFYADRRYEPLWIEDTGVNAAGLAVAGELAGAADWGLEPTEFSLPALPSGPGLTRSERADAEVAISLVVLKYARHARGGRTDPLKLSKNLDRKPPLLDPRAVMDAVGKEQSPDAYLRSLHPQHPQFDLLRQRYLALKRDEAAGAGHIHHVAHMQAKQKASKKAKAPSSAALLRTLLVNMEQWRWMPDDLGAFYVWVNIPEYTLRVMRGGEMVHTERVVVGRTNTQTPVFSDEMEHVIFHPFWGVPDSIKKDELLPGLMRGNSDILARNNLRLQFRGREIDPRTVDWSRADMRKFHVYQPPGRDNVLGVVKFRFPNRRPRICSTPRFARSVTAACACAIR